MQRADELQQEAACLERAAAFLFAEAMRKRALAKEIERIGRAEDANGRKPTPPPCLTGEPVEG